MDHTDSLVTVMKVEKAFMMTFGWTAKSRKLRHLEFPFTHPEYYEEMGLKPHSGSFLYGPPGIGKILLAKAVANPISATFLSVVGPELIQKYIGNGP